MCYIFQVIIFLGLCTAAFSGIFDRNSGKKLDEALIKEYRSKNTLEKCAIDIKSCVPHEGSRVDGTCNNYKYPSRGSAKGPYIRMLKPDNATHSQDKLKKDDDLPSARLVRTTLQSTGRVEDRHGLTAAAVHFLEFMRRDVSIMHGPLDFLRDRQHCCDVKGKSDPRCFPIPVPEHDPYLKLTDIRCLNFSRAETFKDLCSGTTPEQINFQTPLLDLSTIYGTDDKALTTVREYKNGLLKVEKIHLDLSPYHNAEKTTKTDGLAENKLTDNVMRKNLCIHSEDNSTMCYRFGFPEIWNMDLRTSTIGLFFIREHNRIAQILHEMNPCWKEDRLFKVARQITIATASNIFMYELLPILIGVNNMFAYSLISDRAQHITAYDAEVVPLLYAEYDIGMRYFRTLMDGRIKRYDEKYQYISELPLGKALLGKGLNEDEKFIKEMNRGTFYQNAASNDDIQDPEISEHFYGKLQRTYDLPASDIQRARDLEIGSYNEYRHLCGLKRAENFEDFLDVMVHEKALALRHLYKTVDDVDLLAGIMSENFIKDTYVGTTLFCIIAKQLQIFRFADRFWYERGDQYHSLSLDQLQEIRRSNMARLACDNAEAIEEIQPQAFLSVGQSNMHLPCAHVPGPDLGRWYDARCQDYEETRKGKKKDSIYKEQKYPETKSTLKDYSNFFGSIL